MSPWCDVQKKMRMRISEKDYTLTNQRTGGQAVIRESDYEREDAFAWLKERQTKGLV